jgi:hypothetical protein
VTGRPAPDPASVAAFRVGRAAVLASIADACVRVGRDPSEVTLLAVSKTVPPERLTAAVAAGLDLLAENRVQEAAAKIPLVPGARWHLVGPLQSNKARRAVELFETIQSVDSVGLAQRLDRITRDVRALPVDGPVPGERRLPILLEVNVDQDPAKAGFRPEEVEAAVVAIAGLGALRVDGLMTIGRLVATPDEARSTFRGLRALSVRVRATAPALGGALSMGMSDDFPIAVEEGATIVRVGRALFGARPAAAG